MQYSRLYDSHAHSPHTSAVQYMPKPRAESGRGAGRSELSVGQGRLSAQALIRLLRKASNPQCSPRPKLYLWNETVRGFFFLPYGSSSPIRTTGLEDWTTVMGTWKYRLSARSCPKDHATLSVLHRTTRLEGCGPTSVWLPHSEVPSTLSQCFRYPCGLSRPSPCPSSSSAGMNGKKSSMCSRMYSAAAFRVVV